ncbi:MAG: DUF2185 domain-containing protein [Christensenellaceae bacterium]
MTTTNEKDFFPSLKREEQNLVKNPLNGCIVSNKISLQQYKIGYMYRDAPLADLPDSGWVFLAGDEDESYMNTPENHNIFTINTLCNYDPDIIPLLDAPYNTAYYRDDDGSFVEDTNFLDE